MANDVADEARRALRAATKIGLGAFAAAALFVAIALAVIGFSQSGNAKRAADPNALPARTLAAGIIDNFQCLRETCPDADGARQFLEHATATGFSYTPLGQDGPGELQADGTRYLPSLAGLSDTDMRQVADAVTRGGAVTPQTVTDTAFTAPGGQHGTVTVTSTDTTVTLSSIRYTAG